MTMLAVSLSLAVLLFVDWFAANEFYKLAEDKGYHGKKYLLWAFLLPPVGYLLIIAMPDRGGERHVVLNDDLPEL